MNKKSLFILPLSVLMLVGCNGKSGGDSEPTVLPEETFTVVWKNYDGTVLETDTGVKKVKHLLMIVLHLLELLLHNIPMSLLAGHQK